MKGLEINRSKPADYLEAVQSQTVLKAFVFCLFPVPWYLPREGRMQGGWMSVQGKGSTPLLWAIGTQRTAHQEELTSRISSGAAFVQGGELLYETSTWHIPVA